MEYMESLMQDQIEGAQETYERMYLEIEELRGLLSDIAARYESAPFGLPVGNYENARDKAATDFLHWLGTRIVDFVPIEETQSNCRQK